MRSFSYEWSLSDEADLARSDEFLREEDHLKLGSFGAKELTIGSQDSDDSVVIAADSALVAGVECERFDFVEPKDMPDNLFSSREDLRVFSPEEDCEDMKEIHEFRRRELGIFCVSIAAGGGLLLRRLPAFTSFVFCRSSSCLNFLSRSFCSFSALRFSFFLALSP